MATAKPKKKASGKAKLSKKPQPEPDYDDDIQFRLPDKKPKQDPPGADDDVGFGIPERDDPGFADSDGEQPEQQSPRRVIHPQPPEIQREYYDRVITAVRRSVENKIEVERCKRMRDKNGRKRAEAAQSSLDSAVSKASQAYILSTLQSAEQLENMEDLPAFERLQEAMDNEAQQHFERMSYKLPGE